MVLSGVLRGQGNTDALLSRLLHGKKSDCLWLAFGGDTVSPCVNCKACKTQSVCRIADGMQKVYSAAQSAKYVVLASPVYFGNLTGFLLDVLSRFQCCFKDGYRTAPIIGPKKEGAVILTAGGYGETAFAEKQARLMLKMLNVENPTMITSYQTDTVSAISDTGALNKIDALRRRWFS